MNGERGLLRLGEYLVGRACRRLPPNRREERCREWTAELPAILHDPGIRLPWQRAARMLWYAARISRGIPLTSRQQARRLAVSSTYFLALAAFNLWLLARGPFDWVHCAEAAFSLAVVAVRVGLHLYYVHGPGRSTCVHQKS
jgi:hypothetical protein